MVTARICIGRKTLQLTRLMLPIGPMLAFYTARLALLQMNGRANGDP